MNAKDKKLISPDQVSDSTRPAKARPEKPLIVIEPSRNFLNLGDLWRFRDLLIILTLRDLKVRYKQTALGILWAVIQPLFLVLMFTFIFGKLAAMPSDGIPYMLFVLAGLVPWTFFSNTVITSSNSLVGNSNLITKVYFPRLIIPLAGVGAGLVDFAISSILLITLLFFFNISFSWRFLLLPLFMCLTVILAIGVGLWLSAINVKYRDVRHALPFLIQIWLFATPIVYPINLVPETWQWVFMINPLTGLIEGYRSAIFDKPFNLISLGISSLMILVILTYSVFAFHRMEDDFVDIV